MHRTFTKTNQRSTQRKIEERTQQRDATKKGDAWGTAQDEEQAIELDTASARVTFIACKTGLSKCSGAAKGIKWTKSFAHKLNAGVAEG